MQVNVRVLLALFIGLLLIWVGISGRLGSLLGAMITPDAMTEGTPVNSLTANAGLATGIVNQNTKNIAPSKGVLSPIQIATYAVGAGLSSGFNPLAIAVAIALAESGGNTQAISPTGDYGVWQINYNAHRNLGYSQSQLLDPSFNAAAMVTISQNGTNWNPWTTYKTGAYKAFLPQATQAAQSVFAGV